MTASEPESSQAEFGGRPEANEPPPYLRGNGSELPFAPRTSKEIKGLGTWELLFQKAHGRFLQLQIRLAGNNRSTPRLRALRAYYPRFSYLNHYLPAVYREDDESAWFLDRFLANVEGTYTAIEDRIAAAQMLFDTRAAPSDALDWLAAWFGVALDPAWEDERKRIGDLLRQYRPAPSAPAGPLLFNCTERRTRSFVGSNNFHARRAILPRANSGSVRCISQFWLPPRGSRSAIRVY